MKSWQKYYHTVQDIVQKALETQGGNIISAADILAEATRSGGLIHVFGTGHAHLVAEDIYWRSSSMSNTHGIIDPCVSGMHESSKSLLTENLPGLGNIIIDYNRVARPDTIVCISHSGNTYVIVEAALRCVEKGVKVVAIASAAAYKDEKALHPSGKKLQDVANVVVDTCATYSDTAIRLDGVETGIGPVFTIPAAILQTAIMTQAVEILVESGFLPDVYFSGNLVANSDQVKKHNSELIDKYFNKIRTL
ncbi:MAG: sugar isomerase domain-containing protein [Oscillospiraceae bacterium]|nr:sugar isomerase domain-containing protein [Oscillospiraceae bacterium]